MIVNSKGIQGLQDQCFQLISTAENLDGKKFYREKPDLVRARNWRSFGHLLSKCSFFMEHAEIRMHINSLNMYAHLTFESLPNFHHRIPNRKSSASMPICLLKYF